MPKYRIRRETIESIDVKAESEEEAVEIANNLTWDEQDSYGSTGVPNDYDVEKLSEQ